MLKCIKKDINFIKRSLSHLEFTSLVILNTFRNLKPSDNYEFLQENLDKHKMFTLYKSIFRRNFNKKFLKSEDPILKNLYSSLAKFYRYFNFMIKKDKYSFEKLCSILRHTNFIMAINKTQFSLHNLFDFLQTKKPNKSYNKIMNIVNKYISRFKKFSLIYKFLMFKRRNIFRSYKQNPIIDSKFSDSFICKIPYKRFASRYLLRRTVKTGLSNKTNNKESLKRIIIRYKKTIKAKDYNSAKKVFSNATKYISAVVNKAPSKIAFVKKRDPFRGILGASFYKTYKYKKLKGFARLAYAKKHAEYIFFSLLNGPFAPSKFGALHNKDGWFRRPRFAYDLDVFALRRNLTFPKKTSHGCRYRGYHNAVIKWNKGFLYSLASRFAKYSLFHGIIYRHLLSVLLFWIIYSLSSNFKQQSKFVFIIERPQFLEFYILILNLFIFFLIDL